MTDVKADPELMAVEKELIIRGVQDSNKIHVWAEIPTHVRSLLANEHFEETERREIDGDVVAVGGTMPLGCLTISSTSRENNRHNRVISTGD